jgi:hypothetical protein
MNINLANVTAEPVEIFLAERTSETVPVTIPILADFDNGGGLNWTSVGGTKKKSTKATSDGGNTEIHSGSEVQRGRDLTITADAVETTTAKIQTIESFQDKIVDVILRVLESTKYFRIQKVSLAYFPSFAFAYDDPNVISLRMKRSMRKRTDAIESGSLQNYFNIFNPENV